MRNLVGVRFRETGKSKYFDPGEYEFEINDYVVIDSPDGEEMAMISIPSIEVDETKLAEAVVPVKRKATEEDLEKHMTNLADEKEAFRICLEKISARDLPMKLIKSEYTFERNRLLFYFTADGRVDFRELVKDLAAIFHTRIELRQIGVRDETKLLGGIGMCGREFCCKSFLTEFAPVSIKMAKEQRLSLNPNKISGVCGRLMCCLKNEEDTYEYLNRTLPGKGDFVVVSDGRSGTVYAVNVLKQIITVLFEDEENDEKETAEFHISEIKKHRRQKKGHQESEE